MCDACRVPEWVSGVADVSVLERDEEDRPSLVRFTSMPGRASMDYTVRYTYQDRVRTLSWRTEGSEQRTFEGEASIHYHGANRAVLRYAMSASVARSLPAWAQNSFLDDEPSAVAAAFKRWVERQAAT